MQDDQLEHLELGQQRLLIDRELGNSHGEAITLGNLGNAWMALVNTIKRGSISRRPCDRPVSLATAGPTAPTDLPVRPRAVSGETATARDHALSARTSPSPCKARSSRRVPSRARGCRTGARPPRRSRRSLRARACRRADDRRRHAARRDGRPGARGAARGDAARALCWWRACWPTSPRRHPHAQSRHERSSFAVIRCCAHRRSTRRRLAGAGPCRVQVRAAAITDPALPTAS